MCSIVDQRVVDRLGDCWRKLKFLSEKKKFDQKLKRTQGLKLFLKFVCGYERIMRFRNLRYGLGIVKEFSDSQIVKEKVTFFLVKKIEFTRKKIWFKRFIEKSRAQVQRQINTEMGMRMLKSLTRAKTAKAFYHLFYISKPQKSKQQPPFPEKQKKKAEGLHPKILKNTVYFLFDNSS
jgi:hypothetical protein